MPAESDKQRKLMALAEHHPEQVSKKNKGVLSMSKSQLHDFAATKGLKSEHKKETKEGRSIVDVEIVSAKPEIDKLGKGGHGVMPVNYGQSHIKGPVTDGALEFAEYSANRAPCHGMQNGAPVYFGGPDTSYRAEEINPQHYGRDYEPGPYKDLFKTPQKAWEAGIRRIWDDEYAECETPGAVSSKDKAVLAYGTVSFEDAPTENPDYRTFDSQYSFTRQHDEIDAEVDSEDDTKPRAADKTRAASIMRQRH